MDRPGHYNPETNTWNLTPRQVKQIANKLQLTDEGCILFIGHSDPERGPRYTISVNGKTDGPRKHICMRHWAWSQAWEYKAKRLYVVCDNRLRCVNPQHMSEKDPGRKATSGSCKLKNIRKLVEKLEVGCEV